VVDGVVVNSRAPGNDLAKIPPYMPQELGRAWICAVTGLCREDSKQIAFIRGRPVDGVVRPLSPVVFSQRFFQCRERFNLAPRAIWAGFAGKFSHEMCHIIELSFGAPPPVLPSPLAARL